MGTKRGKKPTKKPSVKPKLIRVVAASRERSMFARGLKDPDAPLDLEAANTPPKLFNQPCALPAHLIGVAPGEKVSKAPNGWPWKLELEHEGRRYAMDTALVWWYVSSSEGNRRVATDSPLHERLDRKAGMDRQNLPAS